MNNLKWMYLLRKEPLGKVFPIGYSFKTGYYIYLVLRDKFRKPKKEILLENVTDVFERLNNDD